MIPLIPPTYLRVSTPKAASATASLGSTINIPYLHASLIAAFVFVSSVSFLCFLVIVIILCFVHPG